MMPEILFTYEAIKQDQNADKIRLELFYDRMKNFASLLPSRLETMNAKGLKACISALVFA